MIIKYKRSVNILGTVGDELWNNCRSFADDTMASCIKGWLLLNNLRLQKAGRWKNSFNYQLYLPGKKRFQKKVKDLLDRRRKWNV